MLSNTFALSFLVQNMKFSAVFAVFTVLSVTALGLAQPLEPGFKADLEVRDITVSQLDFLLDEALY